MRRADHVVLKAPNSIMAGIAAVTARIRDGRLKIMNIPEMRPLVQEAYGYAYPEGQDTERPEGRDNHAMDALRYLVAGVDRGRTALLWEDKADEQTEESSATQQTQNRDALATGTPDSPRSEPSPGDRPDQEDWLSADNEELWEYM